ncbi:hypothetical protein IMCC3317_17810 [Kordia antarctica]|uniref:Uncharacterized protein n=1 Tax=Kordia antarctica TaxID=1218801 RepID=A0A7L4ZI58_9FLAO|nr:hypothetical protein [Kordia antarctica]QHI36418.1 hypothetical protein IMCC3317_17810 [Kordia antarctica]
MSNSIIINRAKHPSILADHRVDPVTRNLLKVGDEVCVCAKCKTIYLKSVWINSKKSTCCNQKGTLSYIPNTEYGKPEITPIITKSYQNHCIIFLLATIVFANLFGYWYYLYEKEQIHKIGLYDTIESLDTENYELKQGTQKLKDQYSENLKTARQASVKLESEIVTLRNKINSQQNISILGIYFKPDSGSYGDKIYTSVKYIRPKITYVSSLPMSREMEFKIKIFDSNKILKKGKLSPEGYTYSQTSKIESSSSNFKDLILNGWGNRRGYSYKKGVHTYELWHDEKKIHFSYFTVN